MSPQNPLALFLNLAKATRENGPLQRIPTDIQQLVEPPLVLLIATTPVDRHTDERRALHSFLYSGKERKKRRRRRRRKKRTEKEQDQEEEKKMMTIIRKKKKKRFFSWPLGGSDHKPVILTLPKQVNTSAGKLPPSSNFKKAHWKRFRKLTGLCTESITFSKYSVNKNASNFNLAVLKAAKESIPRGGQRVYKPYWNKPLEKTQKKPSETRKEMEGNLSPQNVGEHA